MNMRVLPYARNINYYFFQVTSSDVPSFVYSKPLIKKQCKTADRVRAMCFNGRRSELAVISTNGYIHCWDGLRFKQVMSKVKIIIDNISGIR